MPVDNLHNSITWNKWHKILKTERKIRLTADTTFFCAIFEGIWQGIEVREYTALKGNVLVKLANYLQIISDYPIWNRYCIYYIYIYI